MVWFVNDMSFDLYFCGEEANDGNSEDSGILISYFFALNFLDLNLITSFVFLSILTGLWLL